MSLILGLRRSIAIAMRINLFQFSTKIPEPEASLAITSSQPNKIIIEWNCHKAMDLLRERFQKTAISDTADNSTEKIGSNDEVMGTQRRQHRRRGHATWERLKSNILKDKSFENKERKPLSQYEKGKIELIEFVIKSCDSVNFPLSFEKLARKFHGANGSSEKIVILHSRISGLRKEVNQWDGIDKNTKVKLIFGLSACLDPLYLEELQKDAVVEVNSCMQIIRYKANDGSLELALPDRMLKDSDRMKQDNLS